MKGLCLDSGEFIPADELNAKWIPRKATEEEMSKEQPEALPVRLAKRLCDGISTGHDWPNTDDELLRMQAAAELRRLAAVEQELEALKQAISEAEPVAFSHFTDEQISRSMDGRGIWLYGAAPGQPLYTLKGIK